MPQPEARRVPAILPDSPVPTLTDQKTLGTRMHTLEIQMAKLEGLLEGLREAITGKRAA